MIPTKPTDADAKRIPEGWGVEIVRGLKKTLCHHRPGARKTCGISTGTDVLLLVSGSVHIDYERPTIRKQRLFPF